MFYLALTDGVSTIDLTNYVLDDGYTPTSEPATVESVVETCAIRLLGTIATARTVIQDLGEMSNNAEYWAAHRINRRVYLMMTWKAGDTQYRSWVKGIKITPSARILGDEQTKNQKSALFEVTWERANWWEYPYTASSNGLPPNAVNGWVRRFTTPNSINGSRVFSIYNSLRYTFTDETIDQGRAGDPQTYAGTTTNVPIHTNAPPKLSWNAGAKTCTGAFVDDVNARIVYSSADVTGYIDPMTGIWEFTFTVAPTLAVDIDLLQIVHGYANWLDIPAASTSWAENDLRVPVGFALKNQHATLQAQIVYAGSISGHGYNLDCQIEGEGTIAVAGTSTVADATCSGAERIDHAFSDSTEAAIAAWPITRANAEKMAGRWFIPIIRFTGAANTGDINNIRYRWAIKDSTNAYYWWQGEQYRPDTSVSQNLVPTGAVRLPPWDVPQSSGASETQTAFYLVLLGQRVDSTARTASIDYVFLMPADSFVKLTTIGRGTNETETLYDIPPYNLSMVSDGTDDNYAVIREYGALMAMPGQDNRFFFLWHGDGSYQSAYDWQIIGELGIYPRKRSL